MNTLLIDYSSASSFVKDRFFQSTSHMQGLQLAEVVKNKSPVRLSPNIAAVESEGGLYILSEKGHRPFLVFDLETCDPFASRRPADALAILQRMLRAAIRLWENHTPSAHDRYVGNKVIVFPLPNDKYRISIQRTPTTEIDQYVHHDDLFAYRDGTSEGAGAAEESDTTLLRAAIAECERIRTHAFSQPALVPTLQLLPVEFTTLDAVNTAIQSPHLGFEKWMHFLTDKQRQFVTRPVASPERLEGPAGTGKTLCLVLRAINLLRTAHTTGAVHHGIFITYGEAQKKAVEEIFDSNDENIFRTKERSEQRQSMTVCTLQEWCGAHLNTGITEEEYLDRDAMESRNARLLYIEESVGEARRDQFPTFERLCSREFVSFFRAESDWSLAEMLQHEIAVMIKGRAEDDLSRYKELPYIRNNLPISTSHDRSFIFSIFRLYQRRLEQIGQFDTDDVVLSAIGQLGTPIWRRRRAHEGFDSIFVDETHLFNINELTVLHYLSRTHSSHPIIFSVDQAQAPGDRGLSAEVLDEAISGERGTVSIEVRLDSVFRSSPDVANFALGVLASGATLFSDLKNPLAGVTSAFTFDDEQRSRLPELVQYDTDGAMCEGALQRALAMQSSLGCGRSEIAIVAFASDLLGNISKEAEKQGRGGIELIQQRGDLSAVTRARNGNRFLLSLPDYIGGLEFLGVVLVGVDEGRVPPLSQARTKESKHFLSFAAHARLYVAITRARFLVDVLVNGSAGTSSLLSYAISEGLIRGEY